MGLGLGGGSIKSSRLSVECSMKKSKSFSWPLETLAFVLNSSELCRCVRARSQSRAAQSTCVLCVLCGDGGLASQAEACESLLDALEHVGVLFGHDLLGRRAWALVALQVAALGALGLAEWEDGVAGVAAKVRILLSRDVVGISVRILASFQSAPLLVYAWKSSGSITEGLTGHEGNRCSGYVRTQHNSSSRQRRGCHRCGSFSSHAAPAS